MEKDFTMSYVWGAVLVCNYIITSLMMHHGINIATKTLSKLKATIITALFNKITRLTSFSIQEANIGKIFNLISNDLNSSD